MECNRTLNDAEIEQQLESMFGMGDGTESEDDFEDSDTDENILNILSNSNINQPLAVDPAFADTLLSQSKPRNTRRRGKHGPEQVTDKWEEVEESESDAEREEGRSSGVVDTHEELSLVNEETSDCESDNIDVATQSTDATTNRRSIPLRISTTHLSNQQLSSDTDEVSDQSDDDSDEDEVEWKKTDWDNTADKSYFDSECIRPRNFFPSRSRPISYFKIFFDDEVLENLIFQTNLYATQTNVRNFTPVTETELNAFFGMLVLMAIHKLPSLEDYWSSDPALHVPEIAETMTLQRFQKISKCLHVNDNEKMPKKGEPGFDKLYKIRPLLEQINKRCQNNARNTKSQSIDESMIKFKGRSSLKQYMPLKPVKRGYKVWARADSKSGYLFQFEIYTGAGDSVEMGLGASVVKTLTQALIDEGTNSMAHIAFDNYFSSYDLLQYLYDNEIYSTATTRIDRVNLPILVKKPRCTTEREKERVKEIMKKQKAKLNKLKKGQYKWRVRGNVSFIIWKDTKLVPVLSTAFHPKEKSLCQRKQKDGTKKFFKCPLAISEYTKRMGGVDRFDRQKALYEVGRRSKKWWKRIFYFLLDVAITDAYILYSNNPRCHNPMNQKNFRLTLARELIDNRTFRKRPFSANPKYSAKKKKSETDSRQKKVFGVPEEIRFTDLGAHFPESIPTYRRCRLCSSSTNNKRSNVQCDTCKVPLCTIPCFKQFHIQSGQ